MSTERENIALVASNDERPSESPEPTAHKSESTPSTIVDNDYSARSRLRKSAAKRAMPAPVKQRSVSVATNRSITPQMNTGRRLTRDLACNSTVVVENSQLDDFNSQYSNIPGLQTTFKHMLQPESLTQGDTQPLTRRVTRASTARLREKYKTSNDDLDMRASMTPFKTPSHPHRSRGEKRKISSAQSEDAGRPSKRQSAFNSDVRPVQVVTTQFINANALYRSPALRGFGASR